MKELGNATCNGSSRSSGKSVSMKASPQFAFWHELFLALKQSVLAVVIFQYSFPCSCFLE